MVNGLDIPATIVKSAAQTLPLEERARLLKKQAMVGGVSAALEGYLDRQPGYTGPPPRYPVRTIPDVVYGNVAGETLCLDLFLPEGAPTPRPGIVLIHGGGWRDRMGTRHSGVPHAVWFAARGFVAASIEYRLAPRYRWPAMLDDCQRAVRWLRKHADDYGVDPHQLAASGGSAGAHLATLLGLIETRDDSDPELAGISSKVDLVLPRAVPVLLWGTSPGRGDGIGLVGAWSPLASQQGVVYHEVFGVPYDDVPADVRRSFDPLAHVTPAAAAFFITHSKRDVIPLSHAVALYDTLRAAGKVPGEDVDLDVVDGTGPAHALQMTIEERSRHDRALWRFVCRRFVLEE
jgi:acetyl esterase/lipase